MKESCIEGEGKGGEVKDQLLTHYELSEETCSPQISGQWGDPLATEKAEGGKTNAKGMAKTSGLTNAENPLIRLSNTKTEARLNPPGGKCINTKKCRGEGETDRGVWT